LCSLCSTARLQRVPACGLERLWQGERQTVPDHQRLLAAGAGGGREPVRGAGARVAAAVRAAV